MIFVCMWIVDCFVYLLEKIKDEAINCRGIISCRHKTVCHPGRTLKALSRKNTTNRKLWRKRVVEIITKAKQTNYKQILNEFYSRTTGNTNRFCQKCLAWQGCRGGKLSYSLMQPSKQRSILICPVSRAELQRPMSKSITTATFVVGKSTMVKPIAIYVEGEGQKSSQMRQCVWTLCLMRLNWPFDSNG